MVSHSDLVRSVCTVEMDRWDTFVKTTSTTSESGASRVLVDLDGTLGASVFDGSCVSTDASASVNGSSSLSPKDHDYELTDSDLSEEVGQGV